MMMDRRVSLTSRLAQITSPLFLGLVIFLLPVASATPQFAEIVSQRDAHTRVFEMPQAREYLDPITGRPSGLVDDSPRRIKAKGTDMNFRDQSGQWQVVDTTIRASQAPGARLEATRQRAKFYFSDTGGESMNVRLDLEGAALETGVQFLAYLEPESGRREIIARAAACPPSAETNRALYSNVFPGVDVEYVNTNTVLKQNVLIRPECALPDPAQFGIDPASALLVVGTELDYTQFGCDLLAQQPEGDLDMSHTEAADAAVFAFRNPAGKAAARFAPGRAWGAEGVGNTAVRKRVEWNAGRPFLLDGVPYAKLRDMPRPAVIDYTLELTASSAKDEVWDRSCTWWVLTEYQVDGTTLVIEPGTVVKLGTNTGADNECIRVLNGGKVRAVGEPLLPIFFTSYLDDGYGEDLDGGQGQMSEGDPAPGDYPAVFYFDSVYGGHDSTLRYCRFRWAENALIAHQASIGVVRDNVFNGCTTAVQLLNPEDGYGIPEVMLINNLIYEGVNGVEFISTGDYNPEAVVDLYFNTFEDLSGAAFLATVDEGYVGALYITALNNVIANVGQGFVGPDEQAQRLHLWSPSLDYTGWAQIGANDKYVGVFATAGGSHTHDQTYTGGSPFDTDHVANGRHYLKQDSNIFMNKGAGSLSTFGLEGTTTCAPVELLCQGYNGSAEWDKQPVDGDAPDLGYHHPRVDYIIGVPTQYDRQVTYFNDDLTIKKGVVVAVYRPDFDQNDPHFTRLACFDTFSVGMEIAQTAELPYAREDMVHFDSSYYLGTNFVRYRWTGQGAPGPYTEADGIWMFGHHNQARAMLLRHLFIGMAFVGCEQHEREHLKGLVFERGDLGIFSSDLPWYYDGDQIPSNLHTMFDAFLNLAGPAVWVQTADTEMDLGYFVTFHNHTVLNCLCAIWMDGLEDVPTFASTGSSDVNVVIGCRLGGILGETRQDPATQPVILGWSGLPPYDPENHDCYWNNGTDSKLDQDTVNVSYLFGDSGELKHRHALLASLPGANLFEKEFHSLYLSQNEGDASRLPFRLRKVKQSGSVITIPQGDQAAWPTGPFAVKVFSLQKVGDWSGSPAYRAYATLSQGAPTVQGYTSAETEGDLLVQIIRTGGMPDETCTGACWFDLLLHNDSVLRICLPADPIDRIEEGYSLCFWVSLDGSAWYAGDTEATGDAANMVTGSARFAMWYRYSAEPPILAMGAFDALGVNPAVDAFATMRVPSTPPYPPSGAWSNGTTSTDGRVDNNTDDSYLPDIVHLLDAGWHYWGWNFFEVQE